MRFLTIKGFSKYEVSDTGIIRNKKTKKVISQHKSNTGYMTVLLYEDKPYLKLVHRLVYDTFIGLEAGKEINHINEDKTDNNLNNLELVIHRVNIKKYMTNHPTHPFIYSCSKYFILQHKELITNNKDLKNKDLLDLINKELRENNIKEVSMRTLVRYKKEPLIQ